VPVPPGAASQQGKEPLNRFPEFLVIGAARAGTTALHNYLRQHPQVFMPEVKEPNFFAFEGEALNCQGPGADYINNSITSENSYLKLFAEAPRGAIRGEASPLYLYAPQAARRIHAHRADTRLVVILRNPIEQAFSHFLYATKQAIEPERDFKQALMLENQRIEAGWQPLFAYSRFPRYGEQLARYLRLFERRQIFIRLYEDYTEAPETLMRDLYAFIGADPDFVPDMSRRLNAGGVPKNRALQDFLMKPNPLTGAIGRVVPRNLRWAIRDRIAAANLKRPETISEEARRILKDRLADEIRALEKMIGRDLGHWLR